MGLTTRMTDTAAGSILLSPDDEISFGTAWLGTALGHLKSASVERTADLELIEKSNGGIRAALLLNPRFELTLQALFTLDRDAGAEGLGDEITFPLSGIKGNVLSVGVEWAEKQHRMLNIKATSWDTLIEPVVYENDSASAEWDVLYDPAA